jgi:hypothetical protein
LTLRKNYAINTGWCEDKGVIVEIMLDPEGCVLGRGEREECSPIYILAVGSTEANHSLHLTNDNHEQLTPGKNQSTSTYFTLLSNIIFNLAVHTTELKKKCFKPNLIAGIVFGLCRLRPGRDRLHCQLRCTHRLRPCTPGLRQTGLLR